MIHRKSVMMHTINLIIACYRKINVFVFIWFKLRKLIKIINNQRTMSKNKSLKTFGTIELWTHVKRAPQYKLMVPHRRRRRDAHAVAPCRHAAWRILTWSREPDGMPHWKTERVKMDSAGGHSRFGDMDKRIVDSRSSSTRGVLAAISKRVGQRTGLRTMFFVEFLSNEDNINSCSVDSQLNERTVKNSKFIKIRIEDKEY